MPKRDNQSSQTYSNSGKMVGPRTNYLETEKNKKIIIPKINKRNKP